MYIAAPVIHVVLVAIVMFLAVVAVSARTIVSSHHEDFSLDGVRILV
ncbi:hypothetical protein [Streptomyces sp. NBC_00271]|nr:hypothetical protein [Streptomyces sp. NBC_00271]